MKAQQDPVQLIEACRHGDEKAWNRLVTQYQSLVYSTALRSGLDETAAVDVFQQVWLELHRSLFRIRDARALPRWLVVTTRRIAYRQAVVSGRWVHYVREDMIDPTPRADAAIVALEERQRLDDALGRLEKRCRELLYLLFLGDKKASYREVGRQLEVSEDTVGSLRTRCLARLRKLMEAER